MQRQTLRTLQLATVRGGCFSSLTPGFAAGDELKPYPLPDLDLKPYPQ